MILYSENADAIVLGGGQQLGKFLNRRFRMGSNAEVQERASNRKSNSVSGNRRQGKTKALTDWWADLVVGG